MGRRYELNSDAGQLFSDFVITLNNMQHCKDCNNSFSYQGSKFCVICGSSRITYNSLKLGDDINMKYSGIITDEYGKALSCPKCKNEVILADGDHCGQCGSFLINECSIIYNDWNDIVIKPCGGDPLPGNFRKCHICGEDSTFTQQGFLNTWEEEKNAIEEFDLEFID
jgi:hypothetical protein